MADIKDDIEKYLNGELNAAEMHALEKKALDDPFLAEALEGSASISADNFKKDIHSIDAAIKKRIHQNGGKAFSWNWPLRIAAGVLLLAASSYIVIKISHDTVEKQEQLALQNESENIAPAENDVKSDSLSEERISRIEETDKPGAEQNIASGEQAPSTSSPAEILQEEEPPIAASESAVGFDVEQDEVALEESEVVVLPQEIETEEKLAKAMPKEENEGPTQIRGYTDLQKDRSKKKSTAGAPAAKTETPSLSDAVFAGNKIVSGKVVDAEDGTPIPGVNVVVNGTAQGTVTDIHGEYEIAVPGPGSNLVFSFIGLENQEVTVGDREEIDVQMSPDVSQLSEVVVVGYGTEEEQPEGTVWELAEPEGGRKEYKKYLEQNLIYPEQAIENKVEGKVTVQFTVEPSGQLSDFRVTKSLGHGCDDEVVRLVKQGPRWSPTRRNTEPVKGKVKVKMKFQLPKEKKEK